MTERNQKIAERITDDLLERGIYSDLYSKDEIVGVIKEHLAELEAAPPAPPSDEEFVKELICADFGMIELVEANPDSMERMLAVVRKYKQPAPPSVNQELLKALKELAARSYAEVPDANGEIKWVCLECVSSPWTDTLDECRQKHHPTCSVKSAEQAIARAEEK